MKLQPQPRPKRRTTRSEQVKAARPRGRSRGPGGQAARPGTPLRLRVGSRLPSIRRLLAATGAVALASVTVALLYGPWLRITSVTWSGESYTAAADLGRLLEVGRGVSALGLDTDAIAASIEALPAVARAEVSVGLDGTLAAAVVERRPAFVWETSSGRFIGDRDGMLFASGPRDDPMPPTLAALPLVEDRRFGSRLMVVGDTIPADVLRVSLQLAGMDPGRLGSVARDLAISLDDRHGFAVTSIEQGWEISLGVYGVDPNETTTDAAARLERQVTAVRTLFATEPESSIAWVDVRNPGKVYFRDKG